MLRYKEWSKKAADMNSKSFPSFPFSEDSFRYNLRATMILVLEKLNWEFNQFPTSLLGLLLETLLTFLNFSERKQDVKRTLKPQSSTFVIRVGTEMKTFVTNCKY